MTTGANIIDDLSRRRVNVDRGFSLQRQEGLKRGFKVRVGLIEPVDHSGSSVFSGDRGLIGLCGVTKGVDPFHNPLGVGL